MTKSKPARFIVRLDGVGLLVRIARTPGAAARQATKHWIKSGRIKRQPKCDLETGGWVGVRISKGLRDEPRKTEARQAAA